MFVLLVNLSLDLLLAPTWSYAQLKHDPYLDFGQEISCSKPRMKYQKDFVTLLQKLKPKDFGSQEFVSRNVKNLNCPSCEQALTQLNSPVENAKTSPLNEVLLFEKFNEQHERDIKCILAAQREFPDRFESKTGFSYTKCSGPSDKTNQKGASGYRPCRTRENAEVMALSLKLVSGCTGMDVADMFPTLQHEGGFNLNVMSPTGAAGIGQLTAGTIESIKAESADAYEDIDDAITRNIYEKKVNPLTGTSCSLLEPYVGVAPRNAASDCEVTTPPKNPILSLMLAAKVFKYHQAEIKKAVDGALLFLDIENMQVGGRPVFSETERKKLERALYIWAYNGGLGGIRTLFKDFMRRTYLNKTPFEYGNQTIEKVTTVKTKKGPVKRTIRVYPSKKFNEATVDDLILGFENFARRKYPNPPSNKKRSREVANYLPAIEKQMQKANTAVGGACFHSEAQAPYAQVAPTPTPVPLVTPLPPTPTPTPTPKQIVTPTPKAVMPPKREEP